jgi:hypothetical protein
MNREPETETDSRKHTRDARRQYQTARDLKHRAGGLWQWTAPAPVRHFHATGGRSNES